VSLKVWALKPAEVKTLDREGLLLLAARCALRVEPWTPREAARYWSRGLELLVDPRRRKCGVEGSSRLRSELGV